VGYTHTTFGAAKTLLAARLHDTGKVYWVDAELGVYLQEALRTYSLLSNFWRTQQSFNTVANTIFYDLPTQFASQLGYTLTDRNLITDIEYHFQEPPTTAWAGGWTGTDMFTMNDLALALQRRRDQFLVDTGVVITRTTPASGAPSGGRITLADTVIDVRRLGWINVSTIPLWRVDEYQLTAYDTTWSTAAAQNPAYYSILSPPPITVQLAPAPTANVTLDLLTVSSGAALTPTAAASLMGVPDDMAWVVKWGAMADLLSKDGPAQDPERAKYCEDRYQQGCELAKLAPILVAARIGGTPLTFASVYEMDAYNLLWQTDTAATPTEVLEAGRNLIALYPQPSGVVSVTLDIVQNAPVPLVDATFMEIGREQLEPLLDYAEHLAMFKVAGDEWKATTSGLENLMKSAALYNSRLAASSLFHTVVGGKPSREETERPRTSPGRE
jgi:hypothetical protein